MSSERQPYTISPEVGGAVDREFGRVVRESVRRIKITHGRVDQRLPQRAQVTTPKKAA